MSRFASEALGKRDRSSFASGNEKIDAYFKTMVTQDVKRRYAACYVLIETATGRLAGFYTLSSYSIPLTEISEETARKLPRYPAVPAVLIGWLGRDLSFRGQDIGTLLVFDAITRVAASPVGAYAIAADAIDDKAAAFYRQHQFEAYAGTPGRLFLPLIRALSLGPFPATNT